jgi:sugar-specific transcriptional regulator TrmB
VYIALLELGDATVADIATKTKLKRTTVYNILPELIAEGFIKTALIKKKKKYYVDDPRIINQQIEEKAKKIQELIPELQAIHNILPYKPKITFYEGLDGLKKAYQDVADNCNAGDTILSYVGTGDLEKFVPKKIANYYIQERIQKRVKNKIIAFKTDTSVKWKNSAGDELREIKLVENESANFNADMKLYKNKVLFLSYRENCLGVIIESKEISNMLKSAFEIMWNSIK